jgi:ribosomal protein L17
MPEPNIEKPTNAKKSHLWTPETRPRNGGRPRGKISLTETIRRKLIQIDPLDSHRQKRKYVDRIVEALMRTAIKGNVQAQMLILNRVDGLQRESIDIKHSGEVKQVVNIIRFSDIGESVIVKKLSDRLTKQIESKENQLLIPGGNVDNNIS